MKKQRLLTILLSTILLVSAICSGGILAFAEEVPDYVMDGLVSFYRGEGNAPDATVWEDSVGDNDLPITQNDNNYFTSQGLAAQGTQHYFPAAIVNLVNGQAFTVEIAFGEFASIGGSFNTFMNSSNDNFAWFRRNSNDNLEFKWAGKSGEFRPKATDGLNLLDNSTVAITFEVGGSCCMYVDGGLVAKVSADTAMGANDLYIGHAESSKLFSTVYRSIRFYNRALTPDEIKSNALADGASVPQGPTDQHVENVTVAQPQTNIVGDVSMIRQIDSKAEMDEMLAQDKLPALAAYSINAELKATDAQGRAFATAQEIFAAHDYRIISVFRIEDQATSDALVAYLKQIRFYDCMVISSDPTVIKAFRTALPQVTGAIDYTDAYAGADTLTAEQCLEIRRSIKANNGTVAILPVAVCTNDTVQYLYDRQVNVWAMTSDAPTAREQYAALLSGAVGVISDSTDALLSIACDQLPENTMTRVPLNIGHRGLPSRAPENTIEGALQAYEQGATVIELDVYLTRDGELAIMHDGTTGRTCDKDISVEGSTMAQLKDLYVNKGYEKNSKYKECRIPTLSEFLEAFDELDCQLFVEVKSSNPAIVPVIKECIESHGMYGQCSIITFNESIMAAMRKEYPEMSVGALCSGYMSGTDAEADLRAAMSFIGKYNATLNPSYGGYEKDDIRVALMRGVSIYPWTFRGTLDTYKNHFMWGYSGLTGDNAHEFKAQVKGVQLLWNDPAEPIRLEAVRYNRTVKGYDPTELIVLEGEELIREENGQYYVQGQGTVIVIPALECKIGKTTYVLFGEICEMTLQEQTTEAATTVPQETQPDAETSDVGEQTTPEVPGRDEKGCKAWMSGTAVVLGLAAAYVLRKKKSRA